VLVDFAACGERNTNDNDAGPERLHAPILT
jgi:hypothetical protein